MLHCAKVISMQGREIAICSPNFIQVGKGRDWKTKKASQNFS